MYFAKALNPADEQRLWDTLTGFACYSYADVAHASGWSLRKAIGALGTQRRAAAAQRAWWTVAPLPKGRRRAADGSLEPYHFVVVDAKTGAALTERDRQSIMRGGLQALEGVERQMQNFATTVRLLSAQLVGAEREQLGDIADILTGAGKMTVGATRRLSARLSVG